ncbi:MAG: thermonuclease family protein [Planctomycetota bacterium]
MDSQERCCGMITRALVCCLLMSSALLSQSYHWFDDSGVAKSSTRFQDVPRSVWSHMRCEVPRARVLSGDTIEVSGGHAIRLIGVDAPNDRSVDGPKAIAAAREYLRQLIQNQALTLRFDRRMKSETYETYAYVYAKSKLLNEEMLNSGLARAIRKPGTTRLLTRLENAQSLARAARRGVWSKTGHTPIPRRDTKLPFRGFSLGLYSSERNFDYRPFIREMKAMGARDLMLITPWFMATPDVYSIKPRKGRSTPLPEVARVVRQAREAGFSVTLMPIVLLTKAPDDKWRGNIKPVDHDAWFGGYNEFICQFADLAELSGVDVFCVGSELSSMEHHEAKWREVIGNVKSRYRGQLSYSANWDHLKTIKWWDLMDYVGMTGYHSLTKKKDPSVAEIATAWSRIRDNLVKIGEGIGKPYFFTELGYASLDGINMNPWDYVSPPDLDEKEQADCYRAWISAWGRKGGLFRGAFFYTWWRNNDDSDAREYSVHGKPAEKILRDWMKSAK